MKSVYQNPATLKQVQGDEKRLSFRIYFGIAGLKSVYQNPATLKQVQGDKNARHSKLVSASAKKCLKRVQRDIFIFAKIVILILFWYIPSGEVLILYEVENEIYN